MSETGMQYNQAANSIEDIRSAANNVKTATENLRETAKEYVEKQIQADWANALLQALNNYYDTDIEPGINTMLEQAAKLEAAQNAIQSYETKAN